MDSYSVNKVILVGRLGRDPEVRYTKNGDPVANLSLATTEVYTSNGERQENTEWHRIVTFGGRAEFAKEYLSKGRMIAVEGKLRTNEWEDSDGNSRYTTEIRATNLTFLDSRGETPQEQPEAPIDEEEEEDEEIPF